MSSDGQVLLVQVAIKDNFFRLFNTIKHIRLSILISIRADAQVHLLGVLIGLERLGDSQNWIRWALLDIGPCGRIETGDGGWHA